jgi:hypothetical protein
MVNMSPVTLSQRMVLEWFHLLGGKGAASTWEDIKALKRAVEISWSLEQAENPDIQCM